MSDSTLVQVDQVLLAHHLSPEERLAVRLLGVVGPDGSWKLDTVQVVREPGRIRLVPRIGRVEGDMFIQMVIPLDHTVTLELPAGKHRIEVESRDGVHAADVEVAPGSRRAPPSVVARPDAAIETGTEVVVPVRIEARTSDGFIEAVAIRETTAGAASDWHPPEFAARDSTGAMQANFSVRRPAGDRERRFDIRATDGQAAAATTPLVLPRR